MTNPRPTGRSNAGASAYAIYRTRLETTRTRRWLTRAVLSFILGLSAGWFLGWHMGLLTAFTAAGADLIYRWHRHSSITAWRKGAAGERATARRLQSLRLAGYAVLHDRALPHSRSNVDHLVIGPTGVFVIDSKKWHRQTTIRSGGGTLWVGRTPMDEVVRPIVFEARAVAEALRRATGCPVDVRRVIAVHGARLPRWRALTAGGTTLLRASRLHGWIVRHPRRYNDTEVRILAAAAERVLPACAWP